MNKKNKGEKKPAKELWDFDLMVLSDEFTESDFFIDKFCCGCKNEGICDSGFFERSCLRNSVASEIIDVLVEADKDIAALLTLAEYEQEYI